jgi:hypothetical protein
MKSTYSGEFSVSQEQIYKCLITHKWFKALRKRTGIFFQLSFIVASYTYCSNTS